MRMVPTSQLVRLVHHRATSKRTLERCLVCEAVVNNENALRVSLSVICADFFEHEYETGTCPLLLGFSLISGTLFRALGVVFANRFNAWVRHEDAVSKCREGEGVAHL